MKPLVSSKVLLSTDVSLEVQPNMSLSFAHPTEVRRTVDATHFPQLVESFLTDKQRHCTARTYVGYVNDLNPFLEWWSDSAPTYEHTFDEEVFADFIDWLDSGYRNRFGHQSTGYTKWRTTKRLRQLLIYAHQKGYVPVSIFDMCPLYEDPGRLKYFPTVEELYRIIHAAEGETRLRDAAIVAFAISTGARRFEIANAEMRHLVFDTPLTQVSTSGIHTGYIRLLKVKGDAEGRGIGRISLFDSVAGLLLKLYLRSVNRTQGTVFGVSDTMIFNIVERLGRRCGIGEIHPHAFRSALVDWWSDVHVRQGHMADIALKLQIGHAVPKEHAIYRYIDTRNEQKTLRRIREFHTSPLLGMAWDWSLWPAHLESPPG